MKKVGIAIATLILTACGSGDSYKQSGYGSVTPAPTTSANPTWATLSAKVFKPYCLSCHNATTPSAGLDLSTQASLLASGVIVAGSPSTSRLYLRITSTNAATRMPKGAPALSAVLVQEISRWITAGAPKEKARPLDESSETGDSEKVPEDFSTEE